MTAPTIKVEATCADCGNTGVWMSAEAINKGGSNRDPGEALCPSCSSSRSVLVRRVNALPNRLDQISMRKYRVWQ